MTYFYKAIAFLLVLLATPSAQACSCRSQVVKDWAGNLRQADVVADYVVEKLRPSSDPSYKIATVRVTRGWKHAKNGARLDVEFGGEDSCPTPIPQIGETAQKKPLILLKRARVARYLSPICLGRRVGVRRREFRRRARSSGGEGARRAGRRRRAARASGAFSLLAGVCARPSAREGGRAPLVR
jgi:hypothetical protein